MLKALIHGCWRQIRVLFPSPPLQNGGVYSLLQGISGVNYYIFLFVTREKKKNKQNKENCFGLRFSILYLNN